MSKKSNLFKFVTLKNPQLKNQDSEPKLELKHIVGYLPYGLQIEILNYKQDHVGIQYSEVNGYYFIWDCLHLKYKGGATGKNPSEFKLILRPLSDLIKEIEHNGETFVPIERIFSMYDSVHMNPKLIKFNDVEKGENKGLETEYFFSSTVSPLTYRLVLKKDPKEWKSIVCNKLHEWHFDIHSLIELGHAIDVNTIKS